MVYLLQTTDDKRNLDKRYNQIASADLLLKEDCSIINPTIIVNGDNAVNCNYVFIDDFNRYYFVDNVVVSNDGRVFLDLHVDVLMSFNAQIKSINTLINRQEFDYSQYIQDSQLLPRVERLIVKKVVGSFGNNISYALTVNGGSING